MTRGVLCLLATVLGPAAQLRADAPSAEVKAAMDEMWRRGTCLLSSVLKPAARESAVPRDIGKTPVLHPRLRAARGSLLCYAVDGAVIWAADDQSLYQVDAAGGKLLKRYGLSDGLPDAAIQSIAPWGDTVWLATRSGLAKLDVRTGKCTRATGIGSGVARLAAGKSGVWLLSESGAYRLPPGRSKWKKLPDASVLKAFATVSGKGFWWARWRVQSASWIPRMFATADGLYAICLGRLLHFPAGGGAGRQISDRTWEAVAQGRSVWALATGGLVRYDAATGKTDRFSADQGLPAGRPVALAAGAAAVFVAAEADYDRRARRFAGGGIGRLDLRSGKWTSHEKIGDTDVRFVTALRADGDEAWAACTLYDRVVQLSAHPGMAHVKRYRPHAAGLALLHFDGKAWRVVPLRKHKPERRWVLGQKGKYASDTILPKRIDRLWRSGDRLWAALRMVPERYYSGYYISAGSLAVRAGNEWQGRFDIRTQELGLAGEQPELMLISHSHGARLVLADGHPVVLGIESVAHRTWAVSENGLFVHDSAAGKFAPVVRTGHRAYWRATCAAAGRHAVWFGGDGGTISRLDRKTGRLELVGVAKGRKIVELTVTKDLGTRDAVLARTAATKAVLPVQLAGSSSLPPAGTIAFDGAKWRACDESVTATRAEFSCAKRGNYVYRGGQRVAFAKGLFRPIVLCEDLHTGKLWLGTYSGVANVDPLEGAGE